MTGYQVYWSGDGGADSGNMSVGADSGNMSVGAGDTDVTINDLTPGLTYDITLITFSDQLPSPITKATFGEPSAHVVMVCLIGQ